MNKLFDLEACCGLASGDGERSKNRPTSAGGTRTVVVTSLYRRKKVRVGPPTLADRNWKPKLCSISEELIEISTKGPVALHGRGGHRSSGGSRSIARLPNYILDDCMRPINISLGPAFSPSPFMI